MRRKIFNLVDFIIKQAEDGVNSISFSKILHFFGFQGLQGENSQKDVEFLLTFAIETGIMKAKRPRKEGAE